MTNKIRILHIDDNLHDRILVREAFREEEELFDVISVENWVKLEECLSTQDFDLVLSDFNILGFDGFKVLEIVKEYKPDIPFIMVTGTGSEEIAVQAMKMGVDDYVIKTVQHIGNLIPTVKNVLENRKANQERKAMIRTLHESEERFRMLFEYNPDAVLLAITDNRFVRVNPAACRMFGRAEEEIIQLGRAAIFDVSDPRLGQALQKRAETGSFFGELTGLRSDGTKFPIEVTSSLFKDKHGSMNSSIIIRDITERKLTEEAMLKRLAHLEHFHQLTVGRELAMIELKKEINGLLRELGRTEKYR